MCLFGNFKLFIFIVGKFENVKIKVGKRRILRFYVKINLLEIKEYGIRLLWFVVV